jgi:hypothetical protein
MHKVEFLPRLSHSMSRCEMVGRYRGSIMGLAWSFFNLILMLVMHSFVFSVVLKVKLSWVAEHSSFAIVAWNLACHFSYVADDDFAYNQPRGIIAPSIIETGTQLEDRND